MRDTIYELNFEKPGTHHIDSLKPFRFFLLTSSSSFILTRNVNACVYSLPEFPNLYKKLHDMK